ncbi:MAG: hypothetical protein KAS32_14795 [Candidatus Peribacteraceae bacterium]|nr:hypothetical protein [Candidatus Peribacteraceae bacterium]
MGDIIEDLTYLSECYEGDDYVDISAQNYFQDALDKITRLREDNERLRQQVEDAQDPTADGPLQSEIAALREALWRINLHATKRLELWVALVARDALEPFNE